MSKFFVAAALFAGCFLSLNELSPLAAEPLQTNPGINSDGESSVDLVLRDKHGHEVRDLRSDEIQIEQDGTPVKIKALRLQNGAGETGTAQQIHLVSIVFDGGDAAAGARIREAISEMFKQVGSAHLYFSVWQIQNRVDLIRGFTNDEAAVREAVQSAVRPLHKGSEAKGHGSAGGTSPSDLRGWDAATQKQFSEVTLKIVNTSEEMSRAQHAGPTLAGLIAMAKQEKLLPGRKAILYVSDGLRISTVTTDQLRVIAGEANRSHVSIYPVDVSGVSQQARDDAAQMVMSTLGLGSGPMAREQARCCPRRIGHFKLVWQTAAMHSKAREKDTKTRS